jgi:hypothetical protein
MVIGGDGSGCTIPYAENLQGISTEIQDRLEFDFKSVISSAAKRPTTRCAPISTPFIANAHLR